MQLLIENEVNRVFMKIFLVCYLVFFSFLNESYSWDIGEDRTRLGERLLLHEMQLLNSSGNLFSTVEVQNLSVKQRSAIGRVFRLPPASIQKFRRGYSVAPDGHHLNQTHWYTVWFNNESLLNDNGVELRTLRVVDGDIVVEEKYWPR